MLMFFCNEILKQKEIEQPTDLKMNVKTQMEIPNGIHYILKQMQ